MQEKFSQASAKMEKTMAENQDFMRKGNEQMNVVVTRVVTEKLEFMMQKYDRVAKGFSKFFNQEELFRVLDSTVS